MRPRVTTVLLAVTGLLVAIAVGLVANAIASRPFTPGVDALPSAGSLAPPVVRTTANSAGTAKVSTTATKPKPAAKPVAKPKATQVTTTPKTTTAKTATTASTTTAAPAPVTTDDHGGSGKGKGSGTSGSGGSSGSGKHGSDD